MAIVSFPTTVIALADTITRLGTSGVAIAAGEIVCLNTATGKYEPAVANVLGKHIPEGIALNSCPAAGQPVTIAIAGRLDGFSALRAGHVYCLANVAGDGANVYSTDLTEDVSYVAVVCIALSATTVLMSIASSGVIMNLI